MLTMLLPLPPGTKKQEFNTPCLLIDQKMMLQNIAEIADLGRKTGIAIRPHTKTHKCPQIARLQIEAGAVGICTATLGEAEVMAAHGITDILITRMVIGKRKIERLLALAREIKLAVVTDSLYNVHELAEAAKAHKTYLTVLIEVGVGTGRCGVLPDSDDLLKIASLIHQDEWLVFGGLQGYAGHTSLMQDDEKQKDANAIADNIGLNCKARLEAAGIPVAVLSGGSSGTCSLTARSGYSELQAGSYVTMDAEYNKVRGDMFQSSLTLLTTVISKPAPNWVIVDAGVKSLSVDRGPASIKGYPQLKYRCAGDEHGKIDAFDGAEVPLEIGQLIELYPSHGCTTINMFDQLHIMKGELLEATWAVAGRGRVD
jgi:D-serine deaminase-like pyridoxal phosphate-dependent protein